MSNSEKLPINPKNPEALTGANLKITINPNTYEILDILVDGYKNRLPPYDEAILPQEYKPESLLPGGDQYSSPKHAMYFWNMCSYMQGAVKTDHAFKQMTKIFAENTDLFDCHFLAQSDPNDISEILKPYGLGRHHSAADHWVKNAKILLDNYDGDPRNVFNGVKSYEDCIERIINKQKTAEKTGFYGFQKKMTSMILYFYMNEDLVPDIRFPMPVDFHALRIALATEMITVKPNDFYTYNHVVEDSLRELFQNYLNDKNVNPIDLTNCIWLLSSNLCNQCIGNHSPDSLRGINYRNMNIEELRQSKSWLRSCGRCLVEKYCRLYISSDPYYDKGAIRPMPKNK